jgi:hypothetical protein
MAHYAVLDENNVVIDIFYGIDETELIDGILPEEWYSNFKKQVCKRTSINTVRNEHKLGGVPFRKNYAYIGGVYDPGRDGFISPKPENWFHEATGKTYTYIFNEDVCDWDKIEVSE